MTDQTLRGRFSADWIENGTTYESARDPLVDGTKHDAGKIRYHLFPVLAEEEIVKVLEYGAQKYAEDNWRSVPNAHYRYYDAMRRHVEAWRKGHKLDDESKQHHLAHAICCLVFLLSFDLEKKTP